jgi:hypothetical protein
MRLTLAARALPCAAALLVLACRSGTVNQAEPARMWEITPELTIGGGESGPTVFSDIRGLAVDDQGRILVLEFAEQEVRMFDSTGAYLKTFGRRGKGPGELQNANGLLRAPDGSYWLNDPHNNRLTVFDAEGQLVRSVSITINSYGGVWDAWFESDGALLETIYDRIDTARVERLRRYRNDGSTIDTLPGTLPCDGLIPRRTRADNYVIEYKQGMTVMQVPFMAMGTRTFDRQGGAWCGVTSAYTLTRVGITAGDTVRLVGTRPALPVSQIDRDSAVNRIKAQVKELGANDPDYARIPALKPIIRRVVIDDSGRPWINPTIDDTTQVWDVFGTDGKQVAVARSVLEISRWQPVVFKGNRIYAITRDSNDVQTVFRGRITRN